MSIGTRLQEFYFRLMKSRILIGGLIACLAMLSTNIQADTIASFVPVAGSFDGEFGWDDFGTTGTPYSGPHEPDQMIDGTGIGRLAVTPGGVITSTANLYSFFSTPTWTFELDGLKTSEGYTSITIQVAVSPSLTETNFTLDGQNPDQLINLGQRASIGGFPYNFYWAEWQGLAGSASYTIDVTGTGQHQSLAGAKATYFNTSSSYDITSAVPEPSSFLVTSAVLGLVWLRRRKQS